MSSAVKVGALVVVFVGLLIGAYAVLGRSLFGPKPDTYFAEFADAGGVTPGTKVLMAGVKVGVVTEVALQGPAKAKVTLAVDRGVAIPAGSTVLIPGSFLGFGETPIQIVPPVAATTARLDPGATLAGTKQRALDSLMPESGTTLKELNATLVATRKLLEDQQLKGKVEDLLETSTKTLARFERLAANVDGIMAENRATVQKAMRSAADTMEELNKGTKMVTALLADPKWKDQAEKMLAQLGATGKKAEDLIVSLNDFVNDPELREPLKRTMENVETMTETGTRVAANTEEMTRNGATLSKKAIELADHANEIAAEAKVVVKKIQDFFQKVPSNVNIQPSYEMDVTRDMKDNRWRSDLTVSAPVKGGRVYAGLWDAFEGNRVTLQLGKPFGEGNEFRYGIFASKPGMGVDYRLAPKTFLRGDLFDINDPRLDLRVRYEFGKDYVGWVGVNRLFDSNSIALGVGVRR
ncbi:MAG: MCE family protein [Fimbriimonadaceae bacterium]|nr:MCE family protein [Fimbriimonadaceae bacterium]